MNAPATSGARTTPKLRHRSGELRRVGTKERTARRALESNGLYQNGDGYKTYTLSMIICCSHNSPEQCSTPRRIQTQSIQALLESFQGVLPEPRADLWWSGYNRN